jgi:hypothetical protein
MMLNIAKLIRNRMIMQNLADNAALSISVHKARVMNFVGNLNYLIGSVLAVGTKPEFIQYPAYSTNAVAAYVTGDNKTGEGVQTLDKDVKHLKDIVDVLKSAQELALQSHIIYIDAIVTKYDIIGGNNYKILILPIMLGLKELLPTTENAEKYFGIKRNTKGIKYIKTVNIDISDIMPHTVANPFPFADILAYAKEKLGDTVDFGDIESMLGLPEDIFEEKVSEEDPTSWYVTDENFSDQKITVILTKDIGGSKPFLAGLLGIKYPSMTVFSASAIYNTKGTMFPSEESDLIGPSDLQVLSYLSVLIQGGIYVGRLVTKDKTPYKLLTIGVTAYLAARAIYAFVKISEGKEHSPITNYNNAKMGGWDAHLIPFKTERGNNQNQDGSGG